MNRIFLQRHEQNEEGAEPVIGPHLILPYRDRTILDDAANLLIHHVKRQTGIQKGEKRRIKQLLRTFLPDLFFHPRQQVSDDEREEDGKQLPNFQKLMFISYNFSLFYNVINFFYSLQKKKKNVMKVQIVRQNRKKMLNQKVV